MTAIRAVAIDLDVLGDTRALWRDWLASVQPVLALDGATLSDDRADAAAELDRLGAGNWRALLERFACPAVSLSEPFEDCAARS